MMADDGERMGGDKRKYFIKRIIIDKYSRVESAEYFKIKCKSHRILDE